jgi:hypothetical protein
MQSTLLHPTFSVYNSFVSSAAEGILTRVCCAVPLVLQQMNVEIQADNHSECSVELLTKKLKIAGGADYDTGSNAGGYRSDAKSIRQKSLAVSCAGLLRARLTLAR